MLDKKFTVFAQNIYSPWKMPNLVLVKLVEDIQCFNEKLISKWISYFIFVYILRAKI